VPRRAKFVWREKVPFWALVAFLLLTFLTGGASRADVQSLIILRPAAVIFCGIALWSLRWEDVKAHKFLFGLAAAIFALVSIHLIPLPPSIWGALPGRELLVEIDRVAELGEVWRPTTMVPPAGWNALYSLFVPLAVLLLSVQLDRERRFQLLPVLLGLGLFSGLIGLLQAVGDPQGPLYLYKVTNNGSAVGLFSNRNHQAVLLAALFPMLAVYASAGVKTEEQLKLRSGMAASAGIVFVPLILVTGSRAGLAFGVLGLLGAALLYRRPQISQPKKRKGVPRFDWRLPIAGFAVLCLGALTVIMSRAEALQRISAPDQMEDLRFRAWGPIADIAWKYFPVGSGAGSFVEVFQIDEPYDLLKPTYLNHAHNDWLELVMLLGLPGLIVAAVALYAWIRTAIRSFRADAGQGRGAPYQRLGLIIILIFALSSAFDYPLRIPSLMCVFVVAALWIYDAGAKKSGSLANSPLATGPGE
jgi:hypothetical protein